MQRIASYMYLLLVAAVAVVISGCAAPKSTSLKVLPPAPAKRDMSVTVASIRDVGIESIRAGFLSPEKCAIDLSEDAELKLGHMLQDSDAFSKVRIIPHGEIPEDATELTYISLARREGTDLVIHGEISHRASFTLNWLTWPSYIPLIVIGAPLWFPNYTLKGKVEMTLHLLDTRTLERIFTRKVSEEAFTSICFLTRFTALHDRFTELEKNVALHNAAVEALGRIFDSLAEYEPGSGSSEIKPFGKVVAVADFQATSSFVERMGYGTAAAEMFANAFEKAGAFKVIERQRIRDVLAERAFTMTDLVKPEKGGQVAKLLGIDYLLVGSVAKVGPRLELNVRLLDISTAKVVLSESDGIKRDADLQILVELMARRIMERFPAEAETKRKEQ